jgi:hypothetical protein
MLAAGSCLVTCQVCVGPQQPPRSLHVEQTRVDRLAHAQPRALNTASAAPARRPATHVGLPTYTQPQLPADLNAGFADGSYTAKDEGTASPVDTIIDAATAAGVDFAGVDVCTYRNNLNKVWLGVWVEARTMLPISWC